MAAGRPIVCANLPPLHDVVDDNIVRFYSPDDPKGLAESIAWVLDHPGEAKQMAERAKDRAQQYAWEARMQRVLTAISVQPKSIAVAV